MTTNSDNAHQQPVPSSIQERVARGHRLAPTGGSGTKKKKAKMLKQIPEAGHSVAVGCCCQLWASRPYEGASCRAVIGCMRRILAAHLQGKLPPTHQHGWWGPAAPARGAGG